jgi:predicted DCC family thiol-disulfide oxidoreductase YuxK
MRNGWTGGQYSLFRAAFGAYLFVHFAQMAPWAAELFSNHGVLPDGRDSPLLQLFPNILALWDGPTFVTSLVIVAAGLSILFAIGQWDRFAAVAIWYVWACLHGRMPLISNPGLPYVGWVLLAHAVLPPAPYGSWAARGRIDPGGSWRMPNGIFLVAWILMALGYSYSGYTKLISPSWRDGTALAYVLENPLARPGMVRDWLLALPADVLRIATWAALVAELSFAPLALVRRLRPWIWAAMLLMHLSLIVVLDFADLSLGMVMLHLFTFDPAWVRAKVSPGPDVLFYDGGCGLCHRAVRFVLAEDVDGSAFRFAPLDSDTFRAATSEETRATLPDSFVVLTKAGTVLTRSAAVRYILARLGGFWRLLGGLAGLVPTWLLDRLYDGVARVRRRLFARPKDACPLLPPHLRKRFTVA